MRNAIIVPGSPDKEEYYNPDIPANSNNYWYPWLSKQLQVNDIFAVVIEPPKPWQPRYSVWKKEFERFEITSETTLVGHSCGGGFLVRWLSENKDKKVGKVVLVAPWINPDNSPGSDTADFFDFEFDLNIEERTDVLLIFNSDNDSSTIQESVEIVRREVKNVSYRELHNHGHFCLGDLKTEEFPELLQELLV